MSWHRQLENEWIQPTMHGDKFTTLFLAIISSVTLLRVVGRLVIKYRHYCTLKLYSGFESHFFMVMAKS
jgi:hypothetical protein